MQQSVCIWTASMSMWHSNRKVLRPALNQNTLLYSHHPFDSILYKLHNLVPAGTLLICAHKPHSSNLSWDSNCAAWGSSGTFNQIISPSFHATSNLSFINNPTIQIAQSELLKALSNTPQILLNKSPSCRKNQQKSFPGFSEIICSLSGTQCYYFYNYLLIIL
jgi:hypothetical protein